MKIFYQDPILHLDKRGDKGNFKIEVADGYRFNPLGPISATWSCPQWQGYSDSEKVNLETNDFLSAADLGCPATFEANLEKVSENGPDYRNDSLISNTSKKDQK